MAAPDKRPAGLTRSGRTGMRTVVGDSQRMSMNRVTPSIGPTRRGMSPDYGFAVLGSYETNQDFTQKRLGFRDDLTYTGFRSGGEHVIKVGVALDRLTYDVNKGNNQFPTFRYGNLVNCNPNCTGDVSYAYKNPFKLEWAAGNPFLTAHNTLEGLPMAISLFSASRRERFGDSTGSRPTTKARCTSARIWPSASRSSCPGRTATPYS